MEGSNSIKALQLALILFITQTGVGIIVLPSALSKEVGHDGWITVAVTGLGIIVFALLIMALLGRYKDKGIYEINKCIYGKYIGTVLNAGVIFYLFAASVVGTAFFTYYIRITLLRETPIWALAPFIALPSFYLVWQGLKNMSRFLFFSIVSSIIILIFLLFLYKDFKLSFVLPIGEAGISNILYSTKTCFLAFLGFETTVFFYPYVTDKQKALKLSIGAILMSTVFYLVFVFVSTITFGENFLNIMLIPFFSLSRVYNAPILERVDLYLTAIWFIPLACSVRTYIFAVYDGMQKVFKLKKTKLTYFIFFVAIIILSSLPKNFNQLLVLMDYISTAGMVLVLFLVLCLVLSFVRKKGVNNNE